MAPELLGIVSPQTELQEVLGADEEAVPMDDNETASPGDSEEEKGQENIEPPVQTACLTAPVPAAQVGSGGVQCVLCPCPLCPPCPHTAPTEDSLPRKAQ